ncbi:hypothetical protein WNY37_06060 [Henriciella sp. AS95]|uniref:hypothetical protein n=1 Tax=Henriciella sp. AS95 TaxID=3135782 RepID=UPI00317CAA84
MLGKLFSRKKNKRSEDASADSPQSGREADFTRPEDFSVTARDLMTEPAKLETAFATAVSKADAGEPFGVALFFALREIAQNSQYVDEMVDELPPWAFGKLPTEHFAYIAHQWARATTEDEKAEHTRFKTYAILAGWRPGDANAYWLSYRTGGIRELPSLTRDPLGREHLPENLEISESELQVYAHLSAEAEKFMGAAGHA